MEEQWRESTRYGRSSVWKKEGVRRTDVEPCINFLIDNKNQNATICLRKSKKSMDECIKVKQSPYKPGQAQRVPGG